MLRGKNRYISIVAIIFIMAVGFFYFDGSNQSQEVAQSQDVGDSKQIQAIIETNFGNIVIEFFPDKAPRHVENFIKLANDGYYNGTTFHRVIPGFMIQGGDPNTKSDDRSTHGQGGPGYTINAEFNDISHVRGIVSMARTNDPNSAGSQFFIIVSDSIFLDNQYTVFGRVVEGIDVADKIVNVPRDNLDNPNDRVVVKRISIRNL